MHWNRRRSLTFKNTEVDDTVFIYQVKHVHELIISSANEKIKSVIIFELDNTERVLCSKT